MDEGDAPFERLISHGGNAVDAAQATGVQEILAHADAAIALVPEGEPGDRDAVLDVIEVDTKAESFDDDVFDETRARDAAAQGDAAIRTAVSIDEPEVFE